MKTLTQKDLVERVAKFEKKIKEIEDSKPGIFKSGNKISKHYRVEINPIVGMSNLTWRKESNIDYDTRLVVNGIFELLYNTD